MSARFSILKAKGSGPFGAPVLSLVQEIDGFGEIVAYIQDESLARRITSLLNRNGLVDVPLPGLEDEGVTE